MYCEVVYVRVGMRGVRACVRACVSIHSLCFTVTSSQCPCFSVSLFICLFIYIYIYICFFVSVSMCFCLYVYISLCLPFSLSICLSIFRFLSPIFHPLPPSLSLLPSPSLFFFFFLRMIQRGSITYHILGPEARLVLARPA